TGTLKQGRGIIRLVNAAGKEVETFSYSDREPFPVLADGLGRSLERRDPYGPTGFPGNWGAARRGGSPRPGSSGGGWVHMQANGTASSKRIYFYLQAPGTVYLDDLVLKPVDGGEEEAVKIGFEDDSQPLS